MKTNDSSHYSPFELESRGWKITQIQNFSEDGSCYNPHYNTFNIFHAFHFPYGKEMKITTLKAVLEFINSFVKEESHKEEIERFNLDR